MFHPTGLSTSGLDGSRGPASQHTLRHTVTWSCLLLLDFEGEISAVPSRLVSKVMHAACSPTVATCSTSVSIFEDARKLNVHYSGMEASSPDTARHRHRTHLCPHGAGRKLRQCLLCSNRNPVSVSTLSYHVTAQAPGTVPEARETTMSATRSTSLRISATVVLFRFDPYPRLYHRATPGARSSGRAIKANAPRKSDRRSAVG